MGNAPTTSTKNYAVQKRQQKRVVKSKRADGKVLVYVCHEVLKEIWIHADEVKHVGVITFVTMSGKQIRRSLVYTWFPQGIWQIKIDAVDPRSKETTAAVVGSQNVDPVIYDRILKLSKGKQVHLYRFIQEGKAPTDQMVDCLHLSAIAKTTTVRVTYATPSADGGGEKIASKPLTDDYLVALKYESVARIFVVMLEHFAGINVDPRIVAGGITRKEYQKIAAIKSKDPDLDVKTIARVVTQAAYEYMLVKGNSTDHLTLMTETLLYQRKRKNALALNNQLEIALGLLRMANGMLATDIGIKQRGKSLLLLYDKYGAAIGAYVGYMDLHYRNIDLNKVPAIRIKIGDPALADFLKVLEQTFSFPTREIYVFLASFTDFYKFIIEEIYRLYGGEIEKKIAQMLPMAIGFFVVHAVLGAMARRGNVYAAALLVVARAAGWIMDVDMALATGAKMAEAGRHFAMMEMIHRRSPKETGKQKLTSLSHYHLAVGTRALIAAIAELVALGVFIAGGKLGQKLAGKLAKFRRTAKEQARLEVHVDGDRITIVRTTKGKTTIEIQTEPTTVKSSGTTRTTPTGRKLRLVDSPPPEEFGPNAGRRTRSTQPHPTGAVKPMEYTGYKSTDARGRPASAEQVSGMLSEHLQAAIAVAREQGVIVLLRVTNPQGVRLIRAGHPPKGKDLIALKTDKVTGKVTAKTSKQYRIAVRKGYYVLGKDGYAYNRSGQRLTGADGKPLKFDMNERVDGELTNRAGQVIDPKTRKAVVGDYDVQDVIRPGSSGQNLAAVPETLGGDVVGPDVRRFAKAFNARLNSQGSVNRVLHGADAQFMQYKAFRKNAFAGDAIGILPDGRVVYFTEAGLARYYRAIGRPRLALPKGARLQPNKK